MPERRLRLMLAAGVVVMACLVIGVLRPALPFEIANRILQIARDSGPAGWVLLAGLQLVIAASGILPASLLGIAAGTTYGLWTGFFLAASGTLGGALVSFVLARFLFRDAIARRLAGHPKLARFDDLISQSGWRIVCLLRISPVMPFAATSYALGLSSVPLSTYILGTLAAMPPLLGYVFIGTLAESGLSGDAKPLRWVMIGLGVVATLGLTVLVGRLAQRAMRPPE